MAVDGITKTLRKQPYYKAMIALLRDEDIAYAIEGGSAHFILAFAVGERKVRVPLPTSPNTRGAAARYVVSNVRKAIEAAREGHAFKI